MDELVKSLRVCGRMTSINDNCISYVNGCCEAFPDCAYALMDQAADAIEFLQTYKICFGNIVSMGGWWLVGQGKNLYRMDVPMNWPPKGTKTVELFPLPEPPEEEP